MKIMMFSHYLDIFGIIEAFEIRGQIAKQKKNSFSVQKKIIHGSTE